MIGLGPARKLVLGGEQISAEEALRIGLIDHLTADSDGVIQTYLRSPATAVAASKYLMRMAFERPLEALVEEERDLFAACLASPTIRARSKPGPNAAQRVVELRGGGHAQLTVGRCCQKGGQGWSGSCTQRVAWVATPSTSSHSSNVEPWAACAMLTPLKSHTG